MTNGYSKEDLIIVSVPTADQVSVMISSASLIAESNSYQESGRKSSISEGNQRKTSTSSIDKKVSFDRGISIQEEEDVISEKIEVKSNDMEQVEATTDCLNSSKQ